MSNIKDLEDTLRDLKGDIEYDRREVSQLHERVDRLIRKKNSMGDIDD